MKIIDMSSEGVKAVRKKRNHEYYVKNREKVLEYVAEYKRIHGIKYKPISELTPKEAEERRQHVREYRNRNREQMRQRRQEYRRLHPPKKNKRVCDMTPEEAIVFRNRNREYYAKHRERILKNMAEYNLAHGRKRKRVCDMTPEEVAQQRKYYRERYIIRRQAILACCKKYRLAHPELCIQRGRDYYRQHRTERRAANAAWRAANPGKTRLYCRRNRAKQTPENIQAELDRCVIRALSWDADARRTRLRNNRAAKEFNHAVNVFMLGSHPAT